MAKRKAQAALEFITTYGWAFMVLLIMVSALSYFGVLDPSRFLPEKCLFGSGIGACTEFYAVHSTDTNVEYIVFKIVNNLGSSVRLTNEGATGTVVTVTGLASPCANPGLQGSLIPGATNGETALASLGIWNTSTTLLLNLSNCAIDIGERPSVQIVLEYTPQGKAFPKKIEGELAVRRAE